MRKSCLPSTGSAMTARMRHVPRRHIMRNVLVTAVACLLIATMAVVAGMAYSNYLNSQQDQQLVQDIQSSCAALQSSYPQASISGC
jgi:uncharacterized membrane protein YebE (DUF533 family)